MKNYLLLLSLLVYSSCDIPNNSRNPYAGKVSNSSLNNGNGSGSRNGNGGGSGNGNDAGSGTTITIPTDAQNCNWFNGITGNYQNPSIDIGNFNICKSSTNSKNIYFQIETPITTTNICFIPTSNISGSPNSFYIGEPRCFKADTNKKIYLVDLMFNRKFFESYPLTGVMIMKDESFDYPYPFNQKSLHPDAYLYCSEMLYQRGISSYCETFKSVNKYTYHKL